MNPSQNRGQGAQSKYQGKGVEYICRGKLTLSGTQCLKQVETSSKINAKNNH